MPWIMQDTWNAIEFMKPWIDYIIRQPQGEPALSRAEFVAKFFPRYVTEWKPSYAIRLNKAGRCVRMTTKGDRQCQQTKRDNRIDAAFNEYLAILQSVPASF
jgi:hypothetical protein